MRVDLLERDLAEQLDENERLLKRIATLEKKLARARRLLRRRTTMDEQVRAMRRWELSSREEALFAIFAAHPRTWVSHERLLVCVPNADQNYLNSLVHRLRKKLALHGIGAIRTKYGEGYGYVPYDEDTIPRKE